MKYIAGFIGCGNMGGAILTACARCVGGENIIASNRTSEKINILKENTGCVIGDNIEVAKESRLIFLGVKPQMMQGVLEGIKDTLKERREEFVLITMAAGLSMEKIRSMSGGDYPVIRIMPNTPVLVGEGMTVYTHTDNVSKADVDLFCRMMKPSGQLDYIDEKFIDAASAVSGCGPAFCYMFIEALADAGVMCGLTREKAMDYVCQTIKGAAVMVKETGEHPEKLKDNVCSPGGSTIEGVYSLERNGFRNASIEAVKCAFEKTKELGK